MAYTGKTYTLDRDDNFREFLTHLQIPEDKIEVMLASKPSQTLEKDGDTYTLTTIEGSEKKEVQFQDGVEFEETVVPGIVAKTTFTFSDGDVLTQVQKFEDGREITVKRAYDDDELLVELKVTGWDGVANRYYDGA